MTPWWLQFMRPPPLAGAGGGAVPNYGMVGALPPPGGAVAPPSLAPAPLAAAPAPAPQRQGLLDFSGDRGLSLGHIAPDIAAAPNLAAALAQLGRLPALRRELELETEEREKKEEDRKRKQEIEDEERRRREEADKRAAELHRLNMKIGRLEKGGLVDERKARQIEQRLRAMDPDNLTVRERAEFERIQAEINAIERATVRQDREASAHIARYRAETDVLKSSGRNDPVDDRQRAAELRRNVQFWKKRESEILQELTENEGPIVEDWSEGAKSLLDHVRARLAEAERAVRGGEEAPAGDSTGVDPERVRDELLGRGASQAVADKIAAALSSDLIRRRLEEELRENGGDLIRAIETIWPNGL